MFLRELFLVWGTKTTTSTGLLSWAGGGSLLSSWDFLLLTEGLDEVVLFLAPAGVPHVIVSVT